MSLLTFDWGLNRNKVAVACVPQPQCFAITDRDAVAVEVSTARSTRCNIKRVSCAEVNAGVGVVRNGLASCRPFQQARQRCR